jgi:hypothetical protein
MVGLKSLIEFICWCVENKHYDTAKRQLKYLVRELEDL